MRILIDTIDIKDKYSLYYFTNDLTRGDFQYCVMIAAALKDYIKNVIDIKGYITMEKCFEHLHDCIGTSNSCNFPIEYMFAGYANSEDVDVQCTLTDNRYRFDFLNVKDISPVLLNRGTIDRKNIINEWEDYTVPTSDATDTNYIPAGAGGRTFLSLYGTEDPNAKVIKNLCEGAKVASFDSERENAAKNIYQIARKSKYASTTNAAIDALEELASKCSFSSSRNVIRKYEQLLLVADEEE